MLFSLYEHPQFNVCNQPHLKLPLSLFADRRSWKPGEPGLSFSLCSVNGSELLGPSACGETSLSPMVGILLVLLFARLLAAQLSL